MHRIAAEAREALVDLRQRSIDVVGVNVAYVGRVFAVLFISPQQLADNGEMMRPASAEFLGFETVPRAEATLLMAMDILSVVGWAQAGKSLLKSGKGVRGGQPPEPKLGPGALARRRRSTSRRPRHRGPLPGSRSSSPKG